MPGTDWPHPWVSAEAMPDEGRLLDLFMDWNCLTSVIRRKILVETPAQLFSG